jgi:hypothetical protein
MLKNEKRKLAGKDFGHMFVLENCVLVLQLKKEVVFFWM